MKSPARLARPRHTDPDVLQEAKMKVRFMERADKDYAALLPEVHKAFAKQSGFLLSQLGHPFPAREEIQRGNNIWQARVNRS